MGINPQFLDVDTLPRCRPPQAVRTRSETAVVIISHNYGRFLGEAIDSVLGQSLPAAEILVVDDSSDDNTAEVAQSYAGWSVRLIRTDYRSAYSNRLRGLRETTARNLIFLDADDVLPADYIAAAERVIAGDPGMGLVNTDFELFGDETGRRELHPVSIERGNYIHAAALVRREAMQAVDWPQKSWNFYCHEDWFLWRELLRRGWRVGKSPVPLRYRKHGASQLALAGGSHPFFHFANLALETVQIVLPLSGREQWFPRLRNWIEQQTWPRISLLVLDSSPQPEFRREVRQWLAGLDCETQYLPLPPTGAVAWLERRNRPQTVETVQQVMPRIYQQAVQRLTREYVFWLEDDVLPPHDAIDRLLQSMDRDVACVSGVVVSRFGENVIGWDAGFRARTERNHGVERIHGTGFGCLLIRRSVLQQHPLHAGGRTHNYDQEFAADLQPTGLRWLIDWSVLCDHAGIPAESLPQRGAP